MAIAKVTIEALTQMANTLRQSADDILVTKEQMDNELHSFPWDDPIGSAFINRYEDDFKPLKEKLIPNIEEYIQYMNQEGVIVSEYSGESTGNLGIGSAVGAGAMGVGVGIASAPRINSNPKKSDLFLNPSESINTGSNKKDHSEFEDPLDYVITNSEKMSQSEFKDPLDYVITDSDKMCQYDFENSQDFILDGSQVPPPVFETDKSITHDSALNVLEKMAKGGFVLPGVLMLQKLNEECDNEAKTIFMNKYNNRLPDDIRLAFGLEKASDYYEDYDNIFEGLKQEVIEIKKKNIDTISKQIEHASAQGGGLESIRAESKLKIDRINLEQEIHTIETGHDTIPLSYDKTYIAGLSEKEMEYLMDHGKMTPGRSANMFTMLKQSNYEFEYEDSDVFSFYDAKNKKQLQITPDGSKISIKQALEIDRSTRSAELTLGKVNQNAGIAWDGKNLEQEHSISKSFGAALSVEKRWSADIGYREDHFIVGEDGIVASAGYSVVLGPEAHVEGSAGLMGGGYKASAEAGIGVANATGKVSASMSPTYVGGTFVQPGIKVEGGASMGGSITGTVDVSDQGLKVGGKVSAGIKVGTQLELNTLYKNELPPRIADRLSESLSLTKKVKDFTTYIGERELQSCVAKP